MDLASGQVANLSTKSKPIPPTLTIPFGHQSHSHETCCMCCLAFDIYFPPPIDWSKIGRIISTFVVGWIDRACGIDGLPLWVCVFGASGHHLYSPPWNMYCPFSYIFCFHFGCPIKLDGLTLAKRKHNAKFCFCCWEANCSTHYVFISRNVLVCMKPVLRLTIFFWEFIK